MLTGLAEPELPDELEEDESLELEELEVCPKLEAPSDELL